MLSEVRFDVYKRHHNHSWLRQQRVLALTADMVEHRTPDNEIKRAFTYDDIVETKLTSRTSFSIAYKCQHTFFFESDDAIKVWYLVNWRIRCIKGLRHLVRGFAVTKDVIERVLLKSQDTASRKLWFGEEGVVEHYAARLMFSIKLRKFLQPGSILESVGDHIELVRAAVSRSHGAALVAYLPSLRRELTTIKDTIVECIEHGDDPTVFGGSSGRVSFGDSGGAVVANAGAGGALPTRSGSFNSSSSSFSDLIASFLPSRGLGKLRELAADSEALAEYVERAVENEILKHHGKRIKDAISECVQQRAKDREFQARLHALMVNGGIDAIGIPSQYAGCPWGLVGLELSLAFDQPTPSAMLDGLEAAARAIHVTCAVANGLALRSGVLSGDDLLPLMVASIVHSGIPDLLSQRDYLQMLIDPDELGERGYAYAVLDAAIEYIASHQDRSTVAAQQRRKNLAASSLKGVITNLRAVIASGDGTGAPLPSPLRQRSKTVSFHFDPTCPQALSEVPQHDNDAQKTSDADYRVTDVGVVMRATVDAEGGEACNR